MVSTRDRRRYHVDGRQMMHVYLRVLALLLLLARTNQSNQLQVQADPNLSTELIEIGKAPEQSVALFAARPPVTSSSAWAREEVAAQRRRRQVVGFPPAATATRPLWEVSFAVPSLTPMSSITVSGFRRFHGEQATSNPIDRAAMEPLGNVSGFVLTLQFRISVANACGADSGSTAKQMLLVGSEYPTVGGSLEVWIDVATCVLCVGPAAIEAPLCSPAGVLKGDIHEASAVYTADTIAKLSLDGAVVTTLSSPVWQIEPTDNMYIGGQPGADGDIKMGFVGDVAKITLYGQALTSEELQHSTAVCGDGLVMHPFEECDDGNENAGDGCAVAYEYDAIDCKSTDIDQTENSKAMALNSLSCQQACDKRTLCTGFAFTPGDVHGGWCYLFGVDLDWHAEKEQVSDWQDLGPGCCGFGSSVIHTRPTSTAAPEEWLSECMQLCEIEPDCGYMNYGWIGPDGSPTATCVLLGAISAAECNAPVASELTCAGVELTGELGVKTYKWTRAHMSCFLRNKERKGLCSIEVGWGCSTPTGMLLTAGEEGEGTADSCVPDCGDGLLVGDEDCDDGNMASNDGCSDGCGIEAGWLCPAVGSACETNCGDGFQIGSEQCDDGNNVGGDGCSAQCMLEKDWTCQLGSSEHYSTCTALPGVPSAPFVTRLQSSVMLATWTRPEQTGAAQILHYKLLVNELEHVTRDHHTWELLQHLPPMSDFTIQVAACSVVGCSEWSDHSDLQHTEALPPVYRIEGGGWQLVRRVAPPTELDASMPSQWHPTSDGLRGSDAFGIVLQEPLDSASFSARFDETQFSQFLVATGDTSQWGVFGRSLVMDGEPCEIGNILTFLGKAAVECAVRDDEGDIELSVSDAQRKFILYRESSRDDTANTRLGTYNGANVFVRAGAGQAYACRGTQDGDCKQFELSKGFQGVVPLLSASAAQNFQLAASELGGAGASSSSTTVNVQPMV